LSNFGRGRCGGREKNDKHPSSEARKSHNTLHKIVEELVYHIAQPTMPLSGKEDEIRLKVAISLG
jgi:hypothetical protein